MVLDVRNLNKDSGRQANTYDCLSFPCEVSVYLVPSAIYGAVVELAVGNVRRRILIVPVRVVGNCLLP